jgi:hypothetical protein
MLLHRTTFCALVGVLVTILPFWVLESSSLGLRRATMGAMRVCPMPGALNR